ncbi:MAG: hypothetical protein NC350_03135 [Corallococcus sp.]|nr:hypothetical protein [Corallococcus sp.]
MNKKLLTVTAVLMVLVFALCACNTSVSDKALAAYKNIGEAKSIAQTVSVKSGDLLIASETLTYDIASNKVTGVKKTLNQAGAAEMWKEEAVNKTFSDAQFAVVLTTEDFNANTLVETADSFAGAVKHENIAKVFGINDAEVNGAVAVKFVLGASDKLATLEVSYTAQSGNFVTIVSQFTY